MWLYHCHRLGGQMLRPYWRLRLAAPPGGVPRAGPLIVAANHASFLDPWFLGIVFPRPVRFLMDRGWYHRSPGWTRFFAALGTVPVSGDGPRDTLRELARHLGRGEAVGVFPEGRVSADGAVGPFHPGVAWLAAATGAAVLPVGLAGASAALPRGRRVPRPARVTVRAGRPRAFPGGPGSPPRRAATAAFLADLRADVVRLLGPDGG